MGKITPLPDVYDRKPVKILLYRWGGKWGPFKVKISCGECTLTKDVIEDTLANELANAVVEVETKDWLTHIVGAFFQGARHAPCVLVNGKVQYVGFSCVFCWRANGYAVISKPGEPTLFLRRRLFHRISPQQFGERANALLKRRKNRPYFMIRSISRVFG